MRVDMGKKELVNFINLFLINLIKQTYNKEYKNKEYERTIS